MVIHVCIHCASLRTDFFWGLNVSRRAYPGIYYPEPWGGPAGHSGARKRGHSECSTAAARRADRAGFPGGHAGRWLQQPPVPDLQRWHPHFSGVCHAGNPAAVYPWNRFCDMISSTPPRNTFTLPAGLTSVSLKQMSADTGPSENLADFAPHHINREHLPDHHGVGFQYMFGAMQCNGAPSQQAVSCDRHP